MKRAVFSSPRSVLLSLTFSSGLLTIVASSDGGGGGGGAGDDGGTGGLAWQTAALLEEDDAGHARYPQVAVDAGGNAMVAWYQSDGTRFTIWARRYAADTGWEAAQAIETADTRNAWGVRVGMDPAGNAVAVWMDDGATSTDIRGNRYVAGVGWGTAEPIEADSVQYAQNPQVGVDASGNAVAVWEQHDGTRYNVWANRYVPDTGWSTPELIETDDAGDAKNPQVAVDAGGNAIAVWEQYDGTRYNVWANRYVAGVGWGTAQLIETDDTGNALSPQVAVDADGNAVAVWAQHDGTRYNVWANRYVPGMGWGTPQLVENSDVRVVEPQVAVDADGNAVAVWLQMDSLYNVWANRYVPGTGWGTPQLIETDDTGHAFSAQVAVDTGGNAVAVWTQYDGARYNVWANRYVNGTGWGTAQLVETDDSGDAQSPKVAVDANGNAVVVWEQNDGTRWNVWVNRGQAP